MTRPGVKVISRGAPPSRTAPSDTGLWFVAGLAHKGKVGEAVEVRNLDEFTRRFGRRVSYSPLYDALDVFFREGGSRALVSRIVGPGADTDSVTLQDDAEGDSLEVSAIGPGESGLAVQVEEGASSGTVRLAVYEDEILVQRSPSFSDVDLFSGWADASDYVRVAVLGEELPDTTAEPVELAGGDDDRANITDEERIASLGAFVEGYGPGQVSIPGATTTEAHVGLLTHAQENNRIALLDAANTDSTVDLATAADDIRFSSDLALEGDAYGALFAPWHRVPGVVRNTTRTVPPSAGAAGLIARSDGQTDNPNVAAAGSNGELRYVLDVSQDEWTDEEREQLNESGVNVFRPLYGGVRLYGYRTLVDEEEDDTWLSLASARLRMAIVNDASTVGEEYIFDQIDGRGRKIAQFGGALTGVLQGYYTLGALFGEEPDDAFIVDVGSSVNTPETIANRELRAIIGLRMSPFAEMVTIEIVKVPVTDSL